MSDELRPFTVLVHPSGTGKAVPALRVTMEDEVYRLSGQAAGTLGRLQVYADPAPDVDLTFAVAVGDEVTELDAVIASGTSAAAGEEEVAVSALAELDVRITGVDDLGAPVTVDGSLVLTTDDGPLIIVLAPAEVSPAPPPAVVTVDVVPAEAEIEEGSTLLLTGTPRDAGGAALSDPLTWSSSATGVATVDETGIVTGVSGGEAVITAEAPNGVEGTAAITVVQPAIYVVDFAAIADGPPPHWTTFVAPGKLVGGLTVSGGEARMTNVTTNDHGISTRDGTVATVGRVRTWYRYNAVPAGFNVRGAGVILAGTANAAAPMGFTGVRLHTDLLVDTGQVILLSECYNQAGTNVVGPGGVLGTFAGLTGATVCWLEAELYYIGSAAHVRIRAWKDGTAVPAWPAAGGSAAGVKDHALGSAMVGTAGTLGLANRGTNPRYFGAEIEGDW